MDGGGCSGFQYLIELGLPKDDDLVLEKAGEKVLIDSISLPFLANAVIDYSDEIIGARFVINNPNANIKLWLWYIILIIRITKSIKILKAED